MLITLIAVAVIATNCATTTPYEPFKIPQHEFCQKTKIIAVAPVAVPEYLETPDPVRARFASIIENKLLEAGFSIVSSEEYAKIWEQMIEKIGGYFDPFTGQRNESKFTLIRKHCLQELCTKYNSNAVLYPEIRVVKAWFTGCEANWHGASDSLKVPTKNKFESFWETCGGGYGTLEAMSLIVTIKDMDNVVMYVNPGGIQVLTRIKDGEGFVPVPRNELFVNAERNITAVEVALEPLVPQLEKPSN
jgi:hypothetical protein